MTAHVTGTATDYDDLLTDLRDFLTTNATLVAANENWVLEKEESIAAYNIPGIADDISFYDGNFRDLYFRGPGLAQQDNIHVNIRQHQKTSANRYNWMIAGATQFSSGLAFEEQVGVGIVGSQFANFALVNASIEYEFMANGRRFIIVCVIEGNTYCSYNGFLLPYGRPSEYPYPLAITGTVPAMDDNIQDSSIRNFYKYANTFSGCMFRSPTNFWYNFFKDGAVSSDENTVWPWSIIDASQYDYRGNPSTPQTFSMLPAILYGRENSEPNIYGDFEGVYYVPKPNGVNLAAGDTITVGSDVYIALQNAGDTGDDSYAAIFRG